MIVASRRRCKNLLEVEFEDERRCEINLPPLVVPKDIKETEKSSYQSLVCRDDLGRYAACPELRNKNQTNFLICDPLG